MNEKNWYLVETIRCTKVQYLVHCDDMVEAQDTVMMREIKPFDKCKLNEQIVSVQVQPNGSYHYVPNCDPVKQAKLEATNRAEAA